MSTVIEVPVAKKLWTDEEFMRLPQDGDRYEIVNGELINMGNSRALHGNFAISLSYALYEVVHSRKLGFLFDSSTAFRLKNGNWRSPDISFFARERLQGMTQLPIGFLDGAPDLAVEILSPNKTVEEIEAKLQDYFENGTRLAWVISPTQHYVLVYRSSQEPDRLLKSSDSLAGEDVVPDFSLPLAELFRPLSFE